MKKKVILSKLQRIFKKHNLPINHSRICADYLLKAELINAQSHGLARLKMYCDRLKKGLINSKPKIKISSEDQLEENPETNLFLAVFGIDFSEERESKNLNQWCLYVEQEIEKRNPNLISQFNNLICEYGFDWEDDYSDSKWDIKEIVYYRISNEFPKIVGSKLSSGIEDVSYTLDMNELKDFEITKEVFLKEI